MLSIWPNQTRFYPITHIGDGCGLAKLQTLPIRREGEDGNVEYVNHDGEPYGHAIQVGFARVDRYVASIEAAKIKGRKIDSVWLPKDLEPEFYGPSIGDTLSAAEGVLNFLQETLSITALDEALSDNAMRGLFYILQGLIDNTARVNNFLEATNSAVSDERREGQSPTD